MSGWAVLQRAMAGGGWRAAVRVLKMQKDKTSAKTVYAMHERDVAMDVLKSTRKTWMDGCVCMRVCLSVCVPVCTSR